ncbi:E3 ubiquitin-protein ligase TRIM58-like [Carettochelys insculpta]|uniref:E3 ubiquitin-protein ligase TRIM58-like n=1 Tax=Carettochelys insculpta TaxID=44489 RepID=UPI003EBB3429
MAAAHPVQVNKAELICSICSDLFQDPVTTECGHSFCQDCITQLCEEGEITDVCPLCRQKFRKENLKPNRELKNIVDSVRQLSASQGEEEVPKCETHKEPLKFYCKDDKSPICLYCKESRPHRGHMVVLIEEAVEDYKETIRKQLEGAEATYEKLHQLVSKDKKLFPQSAREEEYKRLQKLADKTAILFQVDTKGQGRRFEDAASQPQPCEPDVPGRDIDMKGELRGHEETHTKATYTFRKGVELFVRERENVERPARHWAGVEPSSVRTRMSSGRSFPRVPELSPSASAAKRQPGNGAQSVVAELLAEVGLCGDKDLLEQLSDVTLDRATAHPRLDLSRDGKSVRHTGTRQDLPENPACVFGSPGFTSGRHYWEVEGPKRIGVYLDYETGKVTFYKTENMAEISSLTAEFAGEVFPFFQLTAKGSYMKLSPCQK